MANLTRLLLLLVASSCLVVSKKVGFRLSADNRYDLYIEGQYVCGAKQYNSDAHEEVCPSGFPCQVLRPTAPTSAFPNPYIEGCGANQKSTGCMNPKQDIGLATCPNWGKWRQTDVGEVDVPDSVDPVPLIAVRGLQGYPDGSGDNPTTPHAGTPSAILGKFTSGDVTVLTNADDWLCAYKYFPNWYKRDFDPSLYPDDFRTPEQWNYGGGQWATQMNPYDSVLPTSGARWIWWPTGIPTSGVRDIAYCRNKVQVESDITNPSCEEVHQVTDYSLDHEGEYTTSATAEGNCITLEFQCPP